LKDVAEVVLGVDTHLDFHVALLPDQLGRRPGASKTLRPSENAVPAKFAEQPYYRVG
jgi:hypothetical protein